MKTKNLLPYRVKYCSRQKKNSSNARTWRTSSNLWRDILWTSLLYKYLIKVMTPNYHYNYPINKYLQIAIATKVGSNLLSLLHLSVIVIVLWDNNLNKHQTSVKISWSFFLSLERHGTTEVLIFCGRCPIKSIINTKKKS